MFPLSEWGTEHKKLAEEWKNVLIQTKLNQELYDNLIHSIRWVLKYSKDNNLILPNKHELSMNMEESLQIMDKIACHQPTKNTDDINRLGHRTQKRYWQSVSLMIGQGILPCSFRCLMTLWRTVWIRHQNPVMQTVPHDILRMAMALTPPGIT